MQLEQGGLTPRLETAVMLLHFATETRLRVDLNTDEIPTVFNTFCEKVGADNWINRAKKIRGEIKGNNALSQYLSRENEMALMFDGLSRLRGKYGRLPIDVNALRPYYTAMGFAAQTLSLLADSSASNSKRLLGRVRGAFKNPDDMRAMQVELLAATHFIRKGFRIDWPEATNGRHDIDVIGLGSHGLQVECKSISSDKGRKIHRREALEFYSLFVKCLTKKAKNLNTGVILVVTVPDRLPTQYSARMQLCSRMLDRFEQRESCFFEDQVEIRIEEFDFSPIGSHYVDNAWTGERDMLDRITGTSGEEIMIFQNKSGGGVVTVVQSKKDDSFLEATFSTIEFSAKKQVSNTRPVLFFVSFHDLEDGELREIGDESKAEPTALRIHTSKFLNRQDMGHVVGVYYADRGSLEPRIGGSYRHSGATYSFKNAYSLFWEQGFESLFL